MFAKRTAQHARKCFYSTANNNKQFIDQTIAFLQPGAKRSATPNIASDAFASKIFAHPLASVEREAGILEEGYLLYKMEEALEGEKMMLYLQASGDALVPAANAPKGTMIKTLLLYVKHTLLMNDLKRAVIVLNKLNVLVLDLCKSNFSHVSSVQWEMMNQMVFPYIDYLVLSKQYTMADCMCQTLLDIVKALANSNTAASHQTVEFVGTVTNKILYYVNQLFWIAGENEEHYRNKMDQIVSILNIPSLQVKNEHGKHDKVLPVLHFGCNTSYALFFVLRGSHEQAESLLKDAIADSLRLITQDKYTMQHLSLTAHAFAILRHVLMQLNRKLDFEAKLNEFLGKIKAHVNEAIYARFSLLHAPILESEQRYDAMEQAVRQSIESIQSLQLAEMDKDAKRFFIYGLVEGTILLAQSQIYQAQQEQSHAFNAPQVSALHLLQFSLASDYANMIPPHSLNLPNYLILYTYYARSLHAHTIATSSFEQAEQEMAHLNSVLKVKHELKSLLQGTALNFLQLELLNYQQAYDTSRSFIPNESNAENSVPDMFGPSPLHLLVQLQQSIFLLQQERSIDAMEMCKQSHKKLTAQFSTESPLMVDVNNIYGDSISKSSKDAKKPLLASVTSMAERYFRKSTAISEKLGLQNSATRFANVQGIIPLLMMQCELQQ